MRMLYCLSNLRYSLFTPVLDFFYRKSMGMTSRRNFLRSIGAAAVAASLPVAAVRAVQTTTPTPSEAPRRKPKNIVIIIADDLGYGDLGCYGAVPGISPFIDRYVQTGVRFTDAHATASTCTPSRYAMFTGAYAWRKPGTGILPGDAALIINHNGSTLPKAMKAAGMATGAVGKWHLGMGKGPGKTDWNGLIEPNANSIGFDETFLMAATADRVPCVYVENGRIANLDPNDPIKIKYGFGYPFNVTGKDNYPGEPDGILNRKDLKMDWSCGHNQAVVNGVGRIGYMTGGKKALWNDEEMADVFVDRAQRFIKKHKDEPFFLYLGTNDIHVPRIPHPRFRGKTPFGVRGDAILQFDDSVRRVVETLRAEGLEQDTLVIISSDNGPVLDDGYKDRAVELVGNHRPSGPWTGGKCSHHEGGTRVPFIAVWPGVVPAGRVCNAPLSQVDFAATFSALKGLPVQPNAFPDSFDQSALFYNPDAPSVRDHLIGQDFRISLRVGTMKYIYPGKWNGLPTDADPLTGQLYDLTVDPEERYNLARKRPRIAKQMAARLLRAKTLGYTRPGYTPAK